MATNQIYPDVETQRRVITVPTHTAPGTPLIFGGTPYVTLTGSGDYILVSTIAAGDTTTVITKTGAGGVGLGPLQATATPTGTFAFDVVGATAGAALPGTPVYLTSAGAMTLTATSNTLFGHVDFFRGELSATDTAVKIGATN